MATNPIATATATSAVALTAALPKAPKHHPKVASANPAAAPGSTVQISATALAALKESTETPAQTAKEAQGGDSAAQKLETKATAQAAQYKASQTAG